MTATRWCPSASNLLYELADLVEPGRPPVSGRTFNPRVEGSIPSGPTGQSSFSATPSCPAEWFDSNVVANTARLAGEHACRPRSRDECDARLESLAGTAVRSRGWLHRTAVLGTGFSLCGIGQLLHGEVRARARNLVTCRVVADR